MPAVVNAITTHTAYLETFMNILPDAAGGAAMYLENAR